MEILSKGFWGNWSVERRKVEWGRGGGGGGVKVAKPELLLTKKEFS